MKKYTLDGYQAMTMLEALYSDQDPILLHDANYFELCGKEETEVSTLDGWVECTKPASEIKISFYSVKDTCNKRTKGSLLSMVKDRLSEYYL